MLFLSGLLLNKLKLAHLLYHNKRKSVKLEFVIINKIVYTNGSNGAFLIKSTDFYI